MTRSLSAVALSLACWAAPLSAALAADQVVYYREGQSVDPAQVAAVLGHKTRSIRLLADAGAGADADGPAAATASAQPAANSGTEATADALALPVQFAFDSAAILPAARAQLDALAEGIRLLDGRQAVLIEGHTDGRGTAAYNLGLSRRRAEAVKQYLVDEHGLDARRLRTVGYGPTRPLPDTDIEAPRNRRVQFRGV